MILPFAASHAVRYFVLHEMPFENDGNITWDLMLERMNSDLANTLGNLVNRTISMSNKYFDGVVADKGVVDDMDAELKQTIIDAAKEANEKIDELRVADALSAVMSIFKRLNKYIDETEPWVLAKEEEKVDRLSTVLYNLIEGINIGASLLRPFMPETSDKILAQINADFRAFNDMEEFGQYESGKKVTDEPEILFARMKMDELVAMVEADQE